MRIWAKVKKKQRIREQLELPYPLEGDWDEVQLQNILNKVCEKLDLARPIILATHIEQMNRYSKTSFKKADFIDLIDFDSFDIEWIGEKKAELDQYTKIMNDFS